MDGASPSHAITIAVAAGPDGLLVHKRAHDRRGVGRLHREARMLTLARHPGVALFVAFHDLSTEAGAADAGADGASTRGVEAELVTRHVGSHTLATLPARNLAHAIGVLAAVAETVADLHGLGIVHGRLEPSHVIIDPDGRPVLCGFAEATLAGDGSARQPADDVAGLGRLLHHIAGEATETDPIPERRLARRTRAGAFQRRALRNLADQALADDMRARPTARSLAAAIHAVAPEARFLPPPERITRSTITAPTAGATRPNPGTRVGDADADADSPTETATAIETKTATAIETGTATAIETGTASATETDLTVGTGGGVAALPRRPALRPGSARTAGAGAPGTPIAGGPPPTAGVRREPSSAPRRATLGLAARAVDADRRGLAPMAAALVGVAALSFGIVTAARGADTGGAEPVTSVVDDTAPGARAAAVAGDRRPDDTTGSSGSAATTPPEPVAPPSPGRTDLVPSCPEITPPADPAVPAAPCTRSAAPAGGVLTAGGRRFAVGEPGDEVLVGDWACTGQAAPALVRPTTGEVWIFADWAEPDHDRVGIAVASFPPGTHLETGADPGAGNCPALLARTGEGDPVPVTVGR